MIGGTDKATTNYMMDNVFGPRYGYGVDTMTGAAPVVTAPAVSGTKSTGNVAVDKNLKSYGLNH